MRTLTILFFFICQTAIAQVDSLKNAAIIGQSNRNQKVGQGFQIGFVGSSDDTCQINTKLQIVPNAGAGKILGSDANGFATWQAPTVFSNGLTKTGDTVKLGGALTEPTTIGLDTFTLGLTNNDNSIIFAVGQEAGGVTAVAPLIYAEGANMQLTSTNNTSISAGSLLVNTTNFQVDSFNALFRFIANPYASTNGAWYFENHNAGAIASLSLNGSDVNNSSVGLINRDTSSNPNETRDWGFGNFQNNNVYGANMFYWVQPKHSDSVGRDIGYIGVFKSKLTGLPFATIAVATDSTQASGVFAQMNYTSQRFSYGLTGQEPFQVSTSGSVKIEDGTQGAGKVLTSDASGNATWQKLDTTIISSAATLSLISTYNTVNYSFSGTTTTWTLPAASGTIGKVYRIKNRGSGAITLNANSGNEIYSTSATNTFTINEGEAYMLVSDGVYWLVE